jgi:hypothetical protein
VEDLRVFPNASAFHEPAAVTSPAASTRRAKSAAVTPPLWAEPSACDDDMTMPKLEASAALTGVPPS